MKILAELIKYVLHMGIWMTMTKMKMGKVELTLGVNTPHLLQAFEQSLSAATEICDSMRQAEDGAR